MTTVLRELNMKYKFVLPVVAVFGLLFANPDFPGSHPDFWPIRTQEKSSIQIRTKKPDPKHWA